MPDGLLVLRARSSCRDVSLGHAVLGKTAGAVLGVRGAAPQDRLGRRGEAFGEAEPGTKFRHVVLEWSMT